MSSNNLSTFQHKTKLKKVGDKYFLPFEIWNYLDFALMLILTFFFIYTSIQINWVFIFIMGFFIIQMILTIKDRFFIEIKTSKSFNENIHLIKNLAQRQTNFTQSLDEEGLFLFKYSERNIFYKYNYRKRDYIETVVIYCEENSIWVNSFNQRYLGIFRRYNLKQWIKLLKLKSEN